MIGDTTYPSRVTWKAYVQGDSIDLDILLQLFPGGTGDIAVNRTDRGEYFETARLDPYTDGGELHREAARVLRDLNGLARILDGSYRPVILVGRYEDERRHEVQVVAVDTIEVRSQVGTVTVTGGEPAPPPPPPPGPRFFELAARHANVSEAVAITGTASTLGWIELYKLYEIVRDDVGRGKQGLVDAGWITSDELSAFTASANRPDVSGDDARHARMGGSGPNKTMSLPTARERILHLVADWMESRV
jgi:hypothetical protein